MALGPITSAPLMLPFANYGTRPTGHARIKQRNRSRFPLPKELTALEPLVRTGRRDCVSSRLFGSAQTVAAPYA